MSIVRNDARHPATWVSIADYGRLHGAHPKTVRKWLAAGLLKFYRVNRFIRVHNSPPQIGRTPNPAN